MMRCAMFVAVVASVLAMSSQALPAAIATRATPDEMADARPYVAATPTGLVHPASVDVQKGLCSADPLCSFTYNGKPSADFLKTWKIDRKTAKLDDHRTGHSITYSDPAGGLSVRCEAVEYDDFPTVGWLRHFKNSGATDSPTIRNIQALDFAWQREGVIPPFFQATTVAATRWARTPCGTNSNLPESEIAKTYFSCILTE
jgi:hypothetical protein